MKIRLGDHVECRHAKEFRAMTLEELDTDFKEALECFRKGMSRPLVHSVQILMDAPEVLCPECGKVWKVGNNV